MVTGLYENEKATYKKAFSLLLQSDAPNFYTVQKAHPSSTKSFTKIRVSLDSTQLKLFIFLQSLVAISAPSPFSTPPP
jgi:hypothetical protein